MGYFIKSLPFTHAPSFLTCPCTHSQEYPPNTFRTFFAGTACISNFRAFIHIQDESRVFKNYCGARAGYECRVGYNQSHKQQARVWNSCFIKFRFPQIFAAECSLPAQISITIFNFAAISFQVRSHGI